MARPTAGLRGLSHGWTRAVDRPARDSAEGPRAAHTRPAASRDTNASPTRTMQRARGGRQRAVSKTRLSAGKFEGDGRAWSAAARFLPVRGTLHRASRAAGRSGSTPTTWRLPRPRESPLPLRERQLWGACEAAAVV
jgi:hypothetical protein